MGSLFEIQLTDSMYKNKTKDFHVMINVVDQF